MDKTALVENDIRDGERLVDALDNAGFQVEAALWFYLTDSDEWRLLIASPFVERNGPKDSYSFIQSVMAELSEPLAISLKDVSVVSPNRPPISLIRTAVHTGPGISGVRFTRNVINNTLVEDAYIYRML